MVDYAVVEIFLLCFFYFSHQFFKKLIEFILLIDIIFDHSLEILKYSKHSLTFTYMPFDLSMYMYKLQKPEAMY